MGPFLTYADRIPFCKNPLAKNLLTLIVEKQTNLALSADVVRAQEILALADLVGPEICVLKTHVDIIEDFSPEFIADLKHLANKHRFLIFEDRKFADIGHTVKLQYQQGIYRIADWADMVNAHSLPGPGIIEGLMEVGLPKQRGLLLLAEMSSVNNLINDHYTQKTLLFAQQFSDFVIGFISQHKLSSDPQWIYLTPGVQFLERDDALGQRYVTPEKAIAENGTDIIIVGRGILKSDNPAIAAKKYREAGWTAYLSRC